MQNKFLPYLYLFLLFLLMNFFWGCKNNEPKEYNIGFSQCTMDDVWRVQMLKEMEREAYLVKDMKLNISLKDAQSDAQKQINDIRELVLEKIDILIVSPNRSKPLKQIIDSVANLNIPVILVDRHLNTDSKVYYIGASNYQIGNEAGLEAMKLLPDGGHILMFSGLKGSKPAGERKSGFHSVVKNDSSYTIQNIECDWTETTAYREMKNIISNNTSFDLIFAHNDFMARGVIKAIKEASIEIPPIIGVDGLNAPGYGIDMVLDSIMTATFTYPTGGDVAIQTVYKLLTQSEIVQNQVLNSLKINHDNVRDIKVQKDEIDLQIQKIDQQNKLLELKEKEIGEQRRSTRRIILILSLSILGFFGAGYLLRRNIQTKNDDQNEKEFEYSFPIPFMETANVEDKQFVEAIKQLILENMINQKLSIQFIADHFAMSHSTIYRKIKQITGMKGVELIGLIRLQYAEKLLKTTNHSIKEIAFQTGFSTSSYFSTSFLKQFGVNPTEFRKG